MSYNHFHSLFLIAHFPSESYRVLLVVVIPKLDTHSTPHYRHSPPITILQYRMRCIGTFESTVCNFQYINLNNGYFACAAGGCHLQS